MALQHCSFCGGLLKKENDTMYECRECGRKNYDNPRGAVCFIPIKDGRMLLAVRAHEPAKGTYDVIGGFVDYNEDPRSAVHREVKEEAGVEVEILDILDTYTEPYGDQASSMPVVFVGIIKTGTLQPADDVAELEWFDIDKPPSNVAWHYMPAMFTKLQDWARGHNLLK